MNYIIIFSIIIFFQSPSNLMIRPLTALWRIWQPADFLQARLFVSSRGYTNLHAVAYRRDWI